MRGDQVFDERADLAQVQFGRRVRIEHGGVVDMVAILGQKGLHRQFLHVHICTHQCGQLRREVGDGFPEKVTAFRDGMAVHGRYGQPCPECGRPVQRIRYADNECNYCAECQCGGRLLADRGLSALLKKDWPKTLAELEERRGTG